MAEANVPGVSQSGETVPASEIRSADQSTAGMNKSRRRRRELEKKRLVREERARQKLIGNARSHKIDIVYDKTKGDSPHRTSAPTLNCEVNNGCQTVMRIEDFPALTLFKDQSTSIRSDDLTKLTKCGSQHVESSDKASSAGVTDAPTRKHVKKKDPILLNLCDLLTSHTALDDTSFDLKKSMPKQHASIPIQLNPLDSTMPSAKRGKEREKPRKKRPTVLKKAIVTAREERKKWLAEQHINNETSATNNTHSADLPPPSLHSRNFRPYCDHFISPELNSLVRAMLANLVRFQDNMHRQYVEASQLPGSRNKEKERVGVPMHKRRYVCGLHECKKFMTVNRIKMMLIAPNLEDVDGKRGLNEEVASIVHQAAECGDIVIHDSVSNKGSVSVPVVFALNRAKLGRAVCRKAPLSAVGILNYDGTETEFHTIVDVWRKLKEEYRIKSTPNRINHCS